MDIATGAKKSKGEKMNKELTDITVVLDRSGSMSRIRFDTIGGFNTFLEEQQKVPGKANLTLVQFDDEYQIDFASIDVHRVKPLDVSTYKPRGTTALYDAIGRTIVATGERLKDMKEEDRPGNVIFVIITDGAENSSREYTRDMILSMITHQTDKYDWDFVFLGANIDATAVGTSFGIKAGNTMDFGASAAGTEAVFASISGNMRAYRGGDLSKKNAYFTDEDRKAQENEIK